MICSARVVGMPYGSPEWLFSMAPFTISAERAPVVNGTFGMIEVGVRQWVRKMTHYPASMAVVGAKHSGRSTA